MTHETLKQMQKNNLHPFFEGLQSDRHFLVGGVELISEKKYKRNKC